MLPNVPLQSAATPCLAARHALHCSPTHPQPSPQLVCYLDGEEDVFCRVLTVSGTSVSYGAAVEVADGVTATYINVAGYDSAHALVCYDDSAAGRNAYCKPLRLSADILTVDSASVQARGAVLLTCPSHDPCHCNRIGDR